VRVGSQRKHTHGSSRFFLAGIIKPSFETRISIPLCVPNLNRKLLAMLVVIFCISFAALAKAVVLGAVVIQRRS
jgi:hypothetical protein